MSNTELATADFGSVFSNVVNVDLTQYEVAVCLASLGHEKSVPVYQKLQLSEGLADTYRETIRGAFDEYKKQTDKGDVVLYSYEPGSILDLHEVEYLDLSEHSEVEEQIAPLASPLDLGIFNNDAAFINGLRFYVITAQREGDEPIHCFRVYSPKKELQRSTSFAAIFKEGHFDEVREPVLLFDHHIDCISNGSHMFILQKYNFQRIFRFFEMIQEMGREILDEIKEKIPIQNFDDFAASCINHPGKLAKLRNIARSPIVDRVTVDDVKRLIDEYALTVGVVEENGKSMLVYDSVDQWAILRVLEDGYLESRLTAERYEVISKRTHRSRRRT